MTKLVTFTYLFSLGCQQTQVAKVLPVSLLSKTKHINKKELDRTQAKDADMQASGLSSVSNNRL